MCFVIALTLTQLTSKDLIIVACSLMCILHTVCGAFASHDTPVIGEQLEDTTVYPTVVHNDATISLHLPKSSPICICELGLTTMKNDNCHGECHLLLETTVWPQEISQWIAVAGLGLFPVGAAFYVWDYGVKKGDIQVLGAASYTAPLLSTLILIAAGFAEPSLRILAACLLITGGAVLAAHRMLMPSSTEPVER